MKLTTLLLEMKKEEAALDYLTQLVKAGPFKGRVYLAGGAVRDMELGLIPKDLDVVVTGDLNAGMDFAKWATQHMGNYKDQANPILFPTYGTAKFTLKGIVHGGIDLSDVDIEAVATRKEKYTAGSRKPSVSTGDLADDVYRRDFTVNSLLKDLTSGEILDLTGKGKEDIKKGLVQTPLNPDIIFTEDPLRILRAARFSIKYNWDLPMFMLKAMKRNALQLKNISFERIRDELDKMLVLSRPDRALKLLKITGVLEYVIPEFKAAYKMSQNKYHKHDVFQHSIEVLKRTKPTLINRLTAMLHDIGKTKTKTIVDGEVHFYTHEKVGAEMARDILTRLKYPTDIINAVVLGIENHMRLKQAGNNGEVISDKSLRKFSVDLGDHLESLLDVMAADNASHEGNHTMPNQIPNIIKRIDALKSSIPAKNAKLPVTGDDLIALGIKQGPLFKTLLDIVKDQQLEDPNTTKEEYLQLIKNHLKFS
jgi:poly(A) polymerase